MADPLVLFMPSGKRGRFPAGTPVLDAARELGVYVESVCGGRGICGRCQVRSRKASSPSTASPRRTGTSPPGAKEQRYADKRELKGRPPAVLLGDIEGDLVIDIPQDVQVNADRPQGAPTPASSSAIPPSSSATSRSRNPTCTSRSAISTG